VGMNLSFCLAIATLWCASSLSAARGPRARWFVVKAALEQYTQIVGDLNKISYAFTVPVSSDWPESTHCLRLGQVVSRIRNRGDFSQHHQELREVFGLQSRQERQDETFSAFAEALAAYQRSLPNERDQLNLSVPSKCRLPYDSAFPPHLHGYPLGAKMAEWRKVGGEPGREGELLALLRPGTALPSGKQRDRRSPDTLLTALRAYQEKYGNLEIAHSFTVPAMTPFPPETHGYKLGHRVAHIRARGSFAKLRTEIDSIGVFPWIVTKDKELLSILEGLLDAQY